MQLHVSGDVTYISSSDIVCTELGGFTDSKNVLTIDL